MDYRQAPTAEGTSPTKRMFNFLPRSGLTKTLEKLRIEKSEAEPGEPDEKGEEASPKKQSKKMREYQIRDKIWYKSPHNVTKLTGVIVKRNSKMTYVIETESGVRLAHVNQLAPRFPQAPPMMNFPEESEQQPNAEETHFSPDTQTLEPSVSDQEPRRRTRKPPDRYQATEQLRQRRKK